MKSESKSIGQLCHQHCWVYFLGPPQGAGRSFSVLRMRRTIHCSTIAPLLEGLVSDGKDAVLVLKKCVDFLFNLFMALLSGMLSGREESSSKKS